MIVESMIGKIPSRVESRRIEHKLVSLVNRFTSLDWMAIVPENLHTGGHVAHRTVTDSRRQKSSPTTESLVGMK